MATKAIAVSILILRIFVLLASAACVVLLVLNHFTLQDGTDLHFQDVHAFRFMISTAVIAGVYTILQLPFGIYYATTKKRLIRNDCMPEFDFYADKLVSLVLAAGVGAGFAVAFEFKRFLKDLFPVLAALGDFSEEELDEAQTKNDDFYNKAIIATAVLLVGAVCMAVVSVLSSINRTSNRGFFGK